MHYVARHSVLDAVPAPEAEVWNGKLYVSLQYNAHREFVGGGAVPALMLDRWHTTLCVAYYQVDVAWRDVTMRGVLIWWARAVEAQRLANILRNTWDLAFRGRARLQVPLCSPPWQRSWTFGVADGRILDAMVLTRRVAEDTLSARGHRLRARRDIHISWL